MQSVVPPLRCNELQLFYHFLCQFRKYHYLAPRLRVYIVGAITESEAPRKYWSVLKTRLKKQGNELATNCSQLKLVASDGKRYLTDCISQSHVAELAKLIPSKNALTFLDWLTYSDNTIDGQSRKKAYTLYESNLLDTAMTESVADGSHIKRLMHDALTDRINDREMFMKGIDYSYYYEEPE